MRWHAGHDARANHKCRPKKYRRVGTFEWRLVAQSAVDPRPLNQKTTLLYAECPAHPFGTSDVLPGRRRT